MHHELELEFKLELDILECECVFVIFYIFVTDSYSIYRTLQLYSIYHMYHTRRIQYSTSIYYIYYHVDRRCILLYPNPNSCIGDLIERDATPNHWTRWRPMASLRERTAQEHP